jgi:endo-1,4-beta-xylanase
MSTRRSRRILSFACTLLASYVAAGHTAPALAGADRAPGRGLRSFAQAKGLSLGSALNASFLNESTYTRTAAREFNTLTTEGEMKWDYTERSRGVRDFSAGDRLVTFARQHGMKVRGHTLVWSQFNPSWLQTGQFSRSELVDILRNHIIAEVRHYRGKVAEWDVVNEPLDGSGKLGDSLWLRGIGPEYIEMAFRWAHEADPRAKLFINENGVERSGPKLDALVKLVAKLRSRGVPIDGVGFQSHFGGLHGPLTGKTGTELTASMNKFSALRVETTVTELDVAIPSRPSRGELKAQAKVYENVLRACLASPTCDTVIVWGFTDAHSWIPAARPGWGAATLFDAQYRPKVAYEAWVGILAGA